MLDLHNHVLFGLDDGCRTLEESVQLAEAARRAGHVGFVATPHIRPGMFDNDPDAIRRRCDEARPAIEGSGLELYLGAEYYFDDRLLEAARKKSVLTIGESSRFVLIELPQSYVPPRFREVVFEIRVAGYVPVIAHPERCRGVQANAMAAAERFQLAGVLLQLDLGSLVGHYGPEAKRASADLLGLRAYHVAACDLHRPEDVDAIVGRSLIELRSRLKKRGNEGDVAALLEHNPRKILSDAAMEEIEPA